MAKATGSSKAKVEQKPPSKVEQKPPSKVEPKPPTEIGLVKAERPADAPAEAPVVLDNNKRLHFLEERNTQLAIVLAARGTPPTTEDGKGYDDPIGVAIDLIRSMPADGEASNTELALLKRAETAEEAAAAARDQIDRLAAALLNREGFSPQPDEGAGDSAIRVIGELDARLAAAEAGDGAPDAKADARELKKAAKARVATFAELPDTAALTLRFAEGDRFVAALPPRALRREDFAPSGARAALDVDLDFEPTLPPARINAAVLIAGPKTIFCEIPGGLRVGGGAAARIPKGHLVF